MQPCDIARSTPRVVRTEILSRHGAAVIVDGDLDLETASQLDDAISTQIANGHLHFVIDLSDATFLDCIAMGTLLRSSPLF